MDISFEKNIILNIISYVFSKNKVKIPRILMDEMNESCCIKVYLFPSEVHHAVDVILKSQEQVFKFLTKESIDFYYKKRISSEKVFLEYVTFHTRIALLDTFDNPEAATEVFYSMMDYITIFKQKQDFTLNRDKLISISRKIASLTMNKYTNHLVDECQKMHTEATKVVSESPRAAYLVTTFEKVKTTIEIGDKVSENKFLDKDNLTEVERNIGTPAQIKSKTQFCGKPETVESESEKSIDGSAKDSEFVDVELNEEKFETTSLEEKITVKNLSEIIATEDLETVINRGNEDNVEQQLLEAMEDIL